MISVTGPSWWEQNKPGVTPSLREVRKLQSP